MNISEYKGIFVFAEQRDRKVQKVAYELIGKAKELAKDLNTSVTAVLLGRGMKDEAEKLCYAGADKVIYADHELLDEYMTEPYTYTLHKIIAERKPEIVLYGATAIGRDLAPRVSARLKTGLTADCTGLAITEDETNEGQLNLAMTRPAFGGNLMAIHVMVFDYIYILVFFALEGTFQEDVKVGHKLVKFSQALFAGTCIIVY
jgi:electron transfer flavoprotein alpha subunit